MKEPAKARIEWQIFCLSGNDWHAFYRAFCFALEPRYAIGNQEGWIYPGQKEESE